MIRTDAEYRRVSQQLEEARAHYRVQEVQLRVDGVPEDAAEIALSATQTFLVGLQEDLDAYDRAKRGELGTLRSLSDIGRWLIHARIAQGLTQKQLAEKLGVSEALVSRDERNEYHGVTVERAQAILNRMGVQFRIEEAPTAGLASPHPAPPAPGAAAPAPTAYGFLRARKKLSPEKAAEIARAMNAVYDSLTADIPAEPTGDATRE